ncbi:hypothetical protein GW17_00026102 [Ensete ventricosum]|nr:hypothetical protein GW17_00026102 [Ensete ventricosum]
MGITSTGAPLQTGCGRALPLLATSGSPYGRRFYLQAPPLQAATCRSLASTALAGAVGLPCRLALAAPTAPCSQPGRGWPTLHGGWPWLAAPPPPRNIFYKNAARTCRTILRDSISLHAV